MQLHGNARLPALSTRDRGGNRAIVPLDSALAPSPTREGRIHTPRPHKPRTIEITGPGSERFQQPTNLASVSQDVDDGTVTLPVVGRVAAGTPILAEQNVEEVMTLPTSLIGDSSSFILRVRGESMIDAGIFDGDYIVVKEQHDAHNGEIVVALIDDSATVKTFYREKNRIRLQPENDTMEPIYADNPTILGRVTGLLRSL